MPLSKHNVAPVDPLLTRFVVEYTQSKKYFIADKVFPIVGVSNESGTYYKFSDSKGMFTLPDTTERAPGTKYGRGQLGIGDANYTCREDGWEIPVDDRIQKNALPPYDPRRTAAENAAEVVMLRREKNVIDKITNTTTFASYTAALGAGTQWDDDNSEPVEKIDEIKETIRDNCGRAANMCVLAYDAWLALKEHPVIIDRLKITNDKIVTMDLLKRLFDLEYLYVSMAKYNSAQEGQTPSLTDMMTKQAFFGFVADSPSLDRPSVGYTIQSQGWQAKTYREESTNSEIARSSVIETYEIVAPDCGYLLTAVIA